MKDYSTNIEESKTFIKNYKVVDGNIIAKLATGENYIIPFSEENEKTVLQKMKKQAQEAHQEPLTISEKILSISQPLVLPIAISNFINSTGVFYGTLLGITGLTAIHFPVIAIKHKLKEKEIAKLKFFLDNQEELNSNIRKNSNMTLGMRKKAIKQIKKAPVDKPVFDINVIDNYSLIDLKALKSNISRELCLGVNYSKQTLEPGHTKNLVPQNNKK